MTIVVKPVTLENIEEEMEPCLEEFSPEKREEFSAYCKAKKKWFREASGKYGVCGFVAYLDNRPAGLIEFLPVDAVPYPVSKPKETMFILCAYVRRDSQRKGVGRALLGHLIQFLATTPISYFGGKKTKAIEVYVPEPNPKWPAYIQFPTGSKEFYEKSGFKLKRELPKQEGYLYRLELSCEK
jgi:GNAT superfamily N-acetyltransferase